MANMEIRHTHRQKRKGGIQLKFFKPKPKKCSICGTTENVTKKAIPFRYCETCWNKTYTKILPKVLGKIEQDKQSGKKISAQELKQYSDNLAKEL